MLGVSGGAAFGATIAILLGLAARRCSARRSCRSPRSPAASARRSSCTRSRAAAGARRGTIDPARGRRRERDRLGGDHVREDARPRARRRRSSSSGSWASSTCRRRRGARRSSRLRRHRRARSCSATPGASTCSRSATSRPRTSASTCRALERRTLLASSLVVGAIVSVTGLIGFVGLIVPHALRRLLGPDVRVLMPRRSSSAAPRSSCATLCPARCSARSTRAARRRGHGAHRRPALPGAATPPRLKARVEP